MTRIASECAAYWHPNNTRRIIALIGFLLFILVVLVSAFSRNRNIFISRGLKNDLFLCSNSSSERRRQFHGDELDQESDIPDSIAETGETHRFWIPIFAIRLFRPNVMPLHVIRPIQLPRAMPGSFNGVAMMPPPVNRKEAYAIYRHV